MPHNISSRKLSLILAPSRLGSVHSQAHFMLLVTLGKETLSTCPDTPEPLEGKDNISFDFVARDLVQNSYLVNASFSA